MILSWLKNLESQREPEVNQVTNWWTGVNSETQETILLVVVAGILCTQYSRELSFQSQGVFLSGYLIKKSDAMRPVRVNMVDNSSQAVCSTLAPSSYFKELFLPDKGFSPARTARSMREHRFSNALMLSGVARLLSMS